MGVLCYDVHKLKCKLFLCVNWIVLVLKNVYYNQRIPMYDFKEINFHMIYRLGKIEWNMLLFSMIVIFRSWCNSINENIFLGTYQQKY